MHWGMSLQDDIASGSPVASVGGPFSDSFISEEWDDPVAAFSASDIQFDAIREVL